MMKQRSTSRLCPRHSPSPISKNKGQIRYPTKGIRQPPTAQPNPGAVPLNRASESRGRQVALLLAIPRIVLVLPYPTTIISQSAFISSLKQTQNTKHKAWHKTTTTTAPTRHGPSNTETRPTLTATTPPLLPSGFITQPEHGTWNQACRPGRGPARASGRPKPKQSRPQQRAAAALPSPALSGRRKNESGNQNQNQRPNTNEQKAGRAETDHTKKTWAAQSAASQPIMQSEQTGRQAVRSTHPPQAIRNSSERDMHAAG
jgi:hypothetical protein